MNAPAALIFAFVMLGLMWAIVIAPQQKRVKAHNAVVASLAVGQDVMTTSGLCGLIVELDDEFARLEVAPGVVVTFDRRAIAARAGQGSVQATEPATTDHEATDAGDLPRATGTEG